MLERSQNRLMGYALAVFAPAVSLLLRWPLWPVLKDAVPHMTFFPAVMIAAYFGGFWPGFVATCLSKQSRNHHVGEELGKGRKLDDIIASMNMVAEGVKSCAGILAMAGRVSCDMPIASRVGKVLYEGADVKEMVDSLLTREAEPEFMGILGDG